ncbi:MAG: transcriptional repressor NrdR [Dehalococcoidia bacterium]|nr:transcriptional repressor NrdR [Dehalococcoidia bacterium]
MNCPYCDCQNSKVIDSRGVSDGVRRRRQCLRCNARFTTYERIQSNTFMVNKKDARREEFNRDKLITGIRKACAKRPISSERIVELVNCIEREINQMGQMEIPSSIIGELVMKHLKDLDRIAYIRFASVYREFTDFESFRKEVDNLSQKKNPLSSKPQLPSFPKKTTAPSGPGKG